MKSPAARGRQGKVTNSNNPNTAATPPRQQFAASPIKAPIPAEAPKDLQVWIEKDALLGVIEGICTEWRVPHFACRGNNSESLQYQAGKRFEEYLDEGLTPIILHLGDHDPNGIDMTRDNRDRLAMFARQSIEVRRLALNMDQVERYGPPPNFAKETDTRYAAYVEQFGTTECWELDALAPTVIAELVRAEVEALIDRNAWDAAKAEERRNRSLRLGP